MKTRILCTGTFDKLHTGHISYLKTAKNLKENSELFVIVARDKTSKDIKHKTPKNNEKTRLRRIQLLPFVDKAVLGYEKERILERVKSLKPDIIALGYDQWAREDWLKEKLKIKVVRIRKFKKPIDEKNLQVLIFDGLTPTVGQMLDYIGRK